MGWIAFFGSFLLLFVVLQLVGRLAVRVAKGDSELDGLAATGVGLKVASFLFLAVAAISIPAKAFHQVPAGHVGVVYTFGDITGQTDAGLVLTWPWQSLLSATVQVQTLCFADADDTCPDGATKVGEGLDSFSSETQNVFMDAVLRVEVDPSDVQGLYSNVGKSYVNKLIPGSIAQVFKDETVNYKAVDIAPNREPIRANVERAITNELSRFSIDVDALLIENIAFEKPFEEAILDKQKATQEAQAANERVKKAEAEAQQAIAAAQGRAESVKIEADAQAAANATLNASLTSILVQWQAVQKLSDNVQIAFLPSGTGIFLDPANFLSPNASEPAD